MELAGEVEAVGAAVTEFAVGDGSSASRSGAHAEFVCVRESGALAHKPAGMTFEEAAAVCDGALIALACLRAGGPARGPEHPRLRRLRLRRHRGGAARQALRRRTSPRSATRRTSSSCGRSAPTGDRLHAARTSRRTARRTTSSSTPSASTRSGAAGGSLKPGGIFLETDLGFMWHVPLLALLTRWIGDKR